MLRIRPATAQDIQPMLRTHRDAVFAKAASHYTPEELETWSPGVTPDRIARIEKEIADPACVVLVAELDNEIIGFAMAVPAKNELGALYVKPNAIGNVGTKLLSELEKRAFPVAEFLACDASLNAEPFYQAHGYISEGHVEHALMEGGSVTCARMKKPRPKGSGNNL